MVKYRVRIVSEIELPDITKVRALYKTIEDMAIKTGQDIWISIEKEDETTIDGEPVTLTGHREIKISGGS